MSLPLPSVRTALVLVGVLAGSIAAGLSGSNLGAIVPPVAALLVILVTRRALVGLLSGALAGAIVLHDGNPFTATIHLLPDHLFPAFGSNWKMGALVFTLLLGGFAAILERSGGFNRLISRSLTGSGPSGKKLETVATGLGILCFFDGLANSMVVGRVCRPVADRLGVARVKLAYLTDSTSSAVACVAFISTWIAFQLTMIEEAFAQAGLTVNPYLVFLRSLPFNFYCWFTLVMLAVAVGRQFHPGAMGVMVKDTRNSIPTSGTVSRVQVPTPSDGPIGSALIPLLVLILAFLLGFIILGSPGSILPLTIQKTVAAFGSNQGPLVMILAALTASLCAAFLFPETGLQKFKTAGLAFGSGTRAMVVPVFILLAAWMLGSVISGLETANLISRWAGQSDNLALIPAVTFLTGALVSLATGTSWGTMGLLFPLSVPAAAAMGADIHLLHLVVAAVFSGAVFGDHCSPFSDTTIVTSISCGVEPHDHVRTQLPYALITALVAVLVGFLPAGMGLPAAPSLFFGAIILWFFPDLQRRWAQPEKSSSSI